MKVAIVELSESHEECIYTQVSFLKKENYNVSLIVHPKIEKQIVAYKNLIDHVGIYDFDKEKGINKIKLEYKLAQKLATYDKVIFNTASSSKSVRNISLILTFFKVECLGIIHNVNKLNNSFTQKLISKKIKKYFVLSDFLKEKAVLKDKKITLESFYPIFFPQFKKEHFKKNNEIWICIPGRVYYSRRDYSWLLNRIKDVKLNEKIKFLILGNINTRDGIEFKKQVEKNKLSNSFVFFDSFISNTDYYNYINNSDCILPLLQNEETSYLKDKITGTFNLAYAFKKVLLCDSFYNEIPDLKENAIFYNRNSFINVLNNLEEEKAHLVYKYQNLKWNYNFQAKKYISFLLK